MYTYFYRTIRAWLKKEKLASQNGRNKRLTNMKSNYTNWKIKQNALVKTKKNKLVKHIADNYYQRYIQQKKSLRLIMYKYAQPCICTILVKMRHCIDYLMSVSLKSHFITFAWNFPFTRVLATSKKDPGRRMYSFF